MVEKLVDVDLSFMATTKCYNMFSRSEVSIHHRLKENVKKLKKKKKIIPGLTRAQNKDVVKILIDFIVSLDFLYKNSLTLV